MLSALAGRAPVPEVLAVCDDPGVIGAPFYVMRRVAGRRHHRRTAAAVRRARAPPRDRRGAHRRPGRGARRRLARGGAGGLRPPGRLSAAPAQALQGPVGGQPDARHPRRATRWRGGWAPAAGEPARDDRARRLPARQPDLGAAATAARRGHPRLGDVHHRRSAGGPRLPVPVLGAEAAIPTAC